MSDENRDVFLAQEAKRNDYDRWLTTLFAPASARDAIFTLLAFNAEISRVRETVSEVLLGDIRLQWWRDAVSGLGKGNMLDHPVVVALNDVIPRYQLDPAIFQQMIDTRARDLDPCPFETTAELLSYAEGTGGRVNSLIFTILGFTSAEGEAAARKTGSAYALSGIIRAIPHHAQQDLLLIPTDILASEGLAPDTAFMSGNEDAFYRAVRQILEAAKQEQFAARKLMKSRPGAEKSAHRISALTSLYLDYLGSKGERNLQVNFGVVRKIFSLLKT